MSRAALAAVAALALLGGCVDDAADDFVAAAELSEAGVSRLRLDTGDNAVLEPGASAQWRATATMVGGAEADYSERVSWRSADPAIATVSGGQISAVAVGETTITLRHGPFVASAALIVSQAALTAITLAPASASLHPCASVRVEATGRYDDGSERPIDSLLSWHSDDDAVVAIGAIGEGGRLIESLASGQSSASASHAGVSAALVLTVTDTLSDIVISPANTSVAVDASEALSAAARYSDGSSRDISQRSEWSLADAAQSSTLEVDGAKVTGRAAGSASVVAECGGVRSSSPALITVTAATTSARIEIEGGADPLIVPRNADKTLKVEAIDSAGERSDVTADSTFTRISGDAISVSNDSGSEGKLGFSASAASGDLVVVRASHGGQTALISIRIQ